MTTPIEGYIKSQPQLYRPAIPCLVGPVVFQPLLAGSRQYFLIFPMHVKGYTEISN